MSTDVKLQRVYDPSPTVGARVLVDRVWPRGLKKDALELDLWLREVGPSNELRRWFGHRVDRWAEFQRRYRAELEREPQRGLVEQLVTLARRGPVTLLYGARDEEHNQAAVLRSVIEERLRAGAG
jgi:uncharacterized protein YeaO (DUF488 family)